MRNEPSAKLHLLLASLLIIVFCVVTGNAQSDERSLVLKNCTELFGPPVDANKSLFEINSLYAFELRFDSQGRFNELYFFPKYYLEGAHPQWKTSRPTTSLSNTEYEALLVRLNKVKSMGKLIKSMAGANVTNFATDTLDQFEHAFVDRRIELGGGVRHGSLYFFHDVEGKVRKKQMFNYFIPRDREDYYYQVRVGKLNYFVRKEDYLKLRAGRMAKFQAVGPIDGICIDRNCNPLRQHNNSFNRSANKVAFIARLVRNDIVSAPG